MQNLVIIGAGGFGREVYWVAKQSSGYDSDYRFKGFLTKDGVVEDTFDGCYQPVLGSSTTYDPQDSDVFVCAIGDPKRRRIVVETIEERGGTFINIVHESAIVFPNVRIGVGNIIGPATQISCDCVIGNHNVFNGSVIVGHDVKISNYCQINAFGFVGGSVLIENSVIVHPHASIIPGLVIGAGATVGVGSRVLRNVKSNSVVFGNPAKSIL